MIGSKNSDRHWEKVFVKKLNSFLKKAPAVFSVNWSASYVTVTHDNSRSQYRVDFDYNVNPKDLIHELKQNIVVHYPLLAREVHSEIERSPDEIAEEVAKSDSFEVSKTKDVVTSEVWRIDRVLLWKDIFILVNIKEKTAREMKFTGNSAGFLYKYRNGKFDSLEAAGKEFFENATYIRDIKYDDGTSEY